MSLACIYKFIKLLVQLWIYPVIILNRIIMKNKNQDYSFSLINILGGYLLLLQILEINISIYIIIIILLLLYLIFPSIIHVILISLFINSTLHFSKNNFKNVLFESSYSHF